MTSPMAHPRSVELRSWEIGITLALLWAAGAALRITILALPPALPAVVAAGLSPFACGQALRPLAFVHDMFHEPASPMAQVIS
ncbi:hypothetical protein [Methylobacterium sp. UNC300MFChir4.1]|jgi:hypothetical protein|uniref:hypothetical protein n=1 Tax=Methylobacterium sp. UNC300MFChir4.1 TaxID=1502747 RepID=UPI000C20FF3C|nr:hypothetical protein [Methylobacterium sp. UNC300MFChir4.1]